MQYRLAFFSQLPHSVTLNYITQARVSGVREGYFFCQLATLLSTLILKTIPQQVHGLSIQSTSQLLYQPLLLSQHETFLEARRYLSKKIKLAGYSFVISPHTLACAALSSQATVRQCRKKKERREEIWNSRYPSIIYCSLHKIPTVLCKLKQKCDSHNNDN